MRQVICCGKETHAEGMVTRCIHCPNGHSDYHISYTTPEVTVSGPPRIPTKNMANASRRVRGAKTWAAVWTAMWDVWADSKKDVGP